MTPKPPPDATLAALGLSADRLRARVDHPSRSAAAWAVDAPPPADAAARVAAALVDFTRFNVPEIDELLVVSSGRRGLLAHPAAVADHHPADALQAQTPELALFEADDDLYVLVRTDAGDHLARRDRAGGFSVWAVQPRQPSLPDVVVPDPPPVRCPPLAAADLRLRLSPELAAWLDDAGASPDGLIRLAAAGQLIRAWAPGTPAERAALLEARMRGAALPSAVAVDAWLAAASDDDLDALEAAAVDRAMTLCGAVDRLATLHPDGDTADDLLALVVPQREQLAAVRVALSRRQRGRALTEALRVVDAHATADARALASRSARLPRWMADASARFEADAWWVDR
jgi:hypothetical protein